MAAEAKLLKLGTESIAALLDSFNDSDSKVTILDPISTLLKLCLLSFNKLKTKISISGNAIHLQPPGFWTQSGPRYFNGDTKTDLIQLQYPLLYFVGIKNHLIDYNECNITSEQIQEMVPMVISGLKMLKDVYSDRTPMSMTVRCINDFISMLENDDMDMDEFREEQESYDHSIMFAIYEQFSMKWDSEHVKLALELIREIPLITQTRAKDHLLSAIDSYIQCREYAIISSCPS
mgnify:CR=1 FL=1